MLHKLHLVHAFITVPMHEGSTFERTAEILAHPLEHGLYGVVIAD